jgi:hypothetical protein
MSITSVKELREILAQYPDSMEIYLSGDGGGSEKHGCGDLDNITELFPVYKYIYPTSYHKNLTGVGKIEKEEMEKEKREEAEEKISELNERLLELEKDLLSIDSDEDLSYLGKEKKKSSINLMIDKIKLQIQKLEISIKNTIILKESDKVLVLA